MKRGNLIYFLLDLIIINILSTLPFLIIIISDKILFMHFYIYPNFLSPLSSFILHNKFLSFVSDWREQMPMIPQAYDLLIFGISLNYGIRALIERKKQLLNIKLEKILICLVGINMIISTFEVFYGNLPP
jgi:hypothetical protein